MAKSKITIIGLGRVGTSFGLALRKVEGDFEIVGHDRDGAAAAAAKKKGAVDRTEWNLPRSVEGTSLVVLALPVGEVRKVLEIIAEDLLPGAIVTDTTNLKAPIVDWADELLPDGVSFIGGNPIISLGEEDEPRAEVFTEAVYCLTPSPKASEESTRLVSNLISLMGAKPFFVDAHEHDGLMAAVEHLPPLLSAALLDVTTSESSWKEMRRVAAGRYESVTELGAQSVAAFPELYLHNRDNILRWIDLYIEKLREWRHAIAQKDTETLSQAFESALDARLHWLSDRRQAIWEIEGMPRMSERPNFLQQMFLGQRPGRNKEKKD